MSATIKSEKTIESIFKSKNWDYENNDMFRYAFELAYKQFQILSKNETQKETEVYLKLLSLYTVFTIDDYSDLIEDCIIVLVDFLEKIELDKTTKLFFTPLINQKVLLNDENEHNYIPEIDSSTFLMYLQKNLANRLQIDNRSKLKIKEKIKFDWYQIKDSLKKNSDDSNFKNKLGNLLQSEGYFVIVDDFSGSGNSVIETIDKFVILNKDSITRIIVIILVITEEAKKYIMKKHPDVTLLFVRTTLTLNDIYNEEELKLIEENLLLIHAHLRIQINRRNPVFGFKNSGCLLSMLRTPNNTIPLFSHKSKGIYRRR